MTNEQILDLAARYAAHESEDPYVTFHKSHLLNFARALESRVLAERKEPRLWVMFGENGRVLAYSSVEPTNSGFTYTPLFTHPTPDDAIRKLIAQHAEELEQNDYAYFELAYTRRTEWMAWICSNHRDDDPNRKVIAQGQGSTPEEACSAAIDRARQDKESGEDQK
jgi:hypothetical protein